MNKCKEAFDWWAGPPRPVSGALMSFLYSLMMITWVPFSLFLSLTILSFLFFSSSFFSLSSLFLPLFSLYPIFSFLAFSSLSFLIFKFVVRFTKQRQDCTGLWVIVKEWKLFGCAESLQCMLYFIYYYNCNYYYLLLCYTYWFIH